LLLNVSENIDSVKPHHCITVYHMANALQKAIFEAAEIISRLERKARSALSSGTLKQFMQENKEELVSSRRRLHILITILTVVV
jgi:hypothetical protein